jgi:hypothetical protein
MTFREPACEGTTYNGLRVDLNDRGEVFDVEVHGAFFAYGSETRTLSQIYPTEAAHADALRRARAVHLHLWSLLKEECFDLRYDLHTRQCHRVCLIRDIENINIRTWTRSKAKRFRQDLEGLRERVSRDDTKINSIATELNAKIDRAAIARGNYAALKYVADGTTGRRHPVYSLGKERVKLAAGRNENTRLSARYGSDEMLVSFYLD